MKVAVLVVIEGDPSADITKTRKVLYVIKGGVPHEHRTIAMPAMQ